MTPRLFKKLELERLKKQKATVHPKVSNTFIDNALHKSNASAIKTIYYLASVIEDMSQLKTLDDKELLSLRIDAKRMLKYTEMTMPEIKRNIKAMQETSITFIDEKKKTVEGMNLLPYYEIYDGKLIIEIKLFTRIANMIVDVKKNYTRINTKSLMLLKNKHSLRILPLLGVISNYDGDVAKRKHLDLEELNDLFGTKYKTLYDVERKILLPTKEELDSTSSLSFIYELNYINLGKGRPKAKDITIDLIEKASVQGKLF